MHAKKILFIFLDGVGLGTDDPMVNPLVGAAMPNLDTLLNGNKLIANGSHGHYGDGHWILRTQYASLLALDACLGVEGVPQSASGQASLLTGKNVAQLLGYHDGPKPNEKAREILQQGTIFSQVMRESQKAKLMNAYPPRYFTAIESGYRIPGVIALAANYAGMHICTRDDLARGEAISADFTAIGWRDHLGLAGIPTLNPIQAGERLSSLADGCQLAMFEYWLTDVVGHHQDMQTACKLLELFDSVLGSLVDAWDDSGLILITSDHGNLEDLSTRHHTRNDVPLLLIGSQARRDQFTARMFEFSTTERHPNLTDVAPSIFCLIEESK